MKRYEKFFNIAKEISRISDFQRAKVGAVVVENNRIISSGYSSKKTSPLQHKYNAYRHFDNPDKYTPPYIHAEIMALAPIMHQNHNWHKVSIYVYREKKDGTISCARPCEACMALIRKLGIRKIFYTNWEGQYTKEEFLKKGENDETN